MGKLSECDKSNYRRRKTSYDVIRVFCAAAVCIVHFEEAIAPHIANFTAQSVTPLFAGLTLNLFGSGLAAGNLAVGIFFMLSGALSLKALQESPFNIKDYYVHHLGRLLPPLWLAWFVACVWRMLQGGFLFDIPTWRFIFTIFGIDGYIQALTGFKTFYLVGEWFYGAIVFVTLLWPVVRICYLRLGKGLALTLMSIIELVTIIVCEMNNVGSWRTISVCLCSYTIGACIASSNLLRYRKLTVPMSCLLVLVGLFPTPLYATVRYQLVGAGILLISEFYEQQHLGENKGASSQRGKRFAHALSSLSALTLYFFMFQHIVGTEIIHAAAPYIGPMFGTGNYWGLVMLTLLLTLLVALVVYKVEHWIRAIFT